MRMSINPLPSPGNGGFLNARCGPVRPLVHEPQVTGARSEAAGTLRWGAVRGAATSVAWDGAQELMATEMLRRPRTQHP